MILYLTAKTNIPDVYIDYIEVQLRSGETVSLNWDESDISRSEQGFDARYKGVYFGEEYANGRLAELEDMKITDIGLYYETEGTFHFQIEEMQFDDFDNELLIQNPDIPLGCSGMEGFVSVSEQVQHSVDVPLTEHELDMIKESLDVMGDQIADREGYSSGEPYWALKEKLGERDSPLPQRQSLDTAIAAAESRHSGHPRQIGMLEKEPER